MKHKKFTKGKHTYTQWGNVRQVEKAGTPSKLEIAFDDNCAEIYANRFGIELSGEKGKLSFSRVLPPVNRPSSAVREELPLQAIRKLKYDLEAAFQRSKE